MNNRYIKETASVIRSLLVTCGCSKAPKADRTQRTTLTPASIKKAVYEFEQGDRKQPSIHTVLPNQNTPQCQLCLPSIMWTKTKYHTLLLASVTLLSPASSSSHGDGAGGRECIVGTNAFIQLEVQPTQCVTTTVDIVLLTLSHAAAPWQSKSKFTDIELLSTAGIQCKQINVRL